jgi:TRAP-type C4-dicarboxylate transport system permease small subunit
MKKIFSIILFCLIFSFSVSSYTIAAITGDFGTDPITGSDLGGSGASQVNPTQDTSIQLNRGIGQTINTPSLSNGDQNKIPNPLGGNVNSLPAFFSAIVSVVIELGTIISVLAIMYGGFLYVTAQGDPEMLSKAYKTITWALVGTAILLGARTIMYAVTDTVKQLGAGL